MTNSVLTGRASLPAEWPIAASAHSGDLLFISAQNGLGESSSPISSLLVEQLDEALNRLEQELKAAGAAFADVVKIGLFYKQSDAVDELMLMRRIRHRFTGETPVVTAIPLRHLPLPNMGVQVEAIAWCPADGSGKRVNFSEGTPWSQPGDASFSHGVRCGELIFIGGQMSIGQSGEVQHQDDIVGQARITISNIRTVLQGCGADLNSVVKLNTYYVGYGTASDWKMAAQVRSDAFVKPGPGATGVPVPGPYPNGLLIRQECIAMADPDGAPVPRKTSWPEGHWDWPIPVSFEQGLQLENYIFLGGQVAADISGNAIHPGDLEKQTADCMDNIGRIMAGFGATVKNLVKVTVFYATKGDPEDLRTVLNVLRGYFPDGLPAFTAVPLDKLGFEDIMIEIEGIGIA